MDNWIMIYKSFNYSKDELFIYKKYIFHDNHEELLFCSSCRILELPSNLIFVDNDPNSNNIPNLYNPITGEILVINIKDEDYELIKIYSTYTET